MATKATLATAGTMGATRASLATLRNRRCTCACSPSVSSSQYYGGGLVAGVVANKRRGVGQRKQRRRGQAKTKRDVRFWSNQDENMAYEEAREAQSPTYEDLEAQAEAFMKAQSAIETGENEEPDTSQNVAEYGTAEVTDEELELYTAEVLDLLKLLLKRRDMTINEVKLILAIEDPRAQEARRVYGIEDESGVSREEISQCFVDLCENKKINNRIALRELRKEFINWPGLLEEEGSKQAEQEEEGEGSKELVVNELAKPAANPKIGREDEVDSGLPKGLADYLPDWMGYGVLYSFSIVPILITVVAIGILWVNSFSN